MRICDKEGVVYIHVVVKHGGPNCGLLQLSALFMDADLNLFDEFNEYVCPPDDASWDSKDLHV